MENKVFGYGRVSSKGQNQDRQRQALEEYGIDERDIYIDECTGVNFRRKYYHALETILQEGDTVVITSIDRLGRNKKATEREYNKLVDKGVKLIFLEEPKLNSDVCKEENLSISTYMAEQEAKKIRQRVQQGIDAMPVDENGRKYSSKTGNYIGRPNLDYPENFVEVYTAWKNGEILAKDAIEMTGVSKGTFYKLVHQYEEENGIA